MRVVRIAGWIILGFFAALALLDVLAFLFGLAYGLRTGRTLPYPKAQTTAQTTRSTPDEHHDRGPADDRQQAC
jgi:hypothetical protein